jgi:hypothetical protein
MSQDLSLCQKINWAALEQEFSPAMEGSKNTGPNCYPM